jgi:hypothetical protein
MLRVRVDSVICRECGGQAVLTRKLDERELGTVTTFETRCQDPSCGKVLGSVLQGDHLR